MISMQGTDLFAGTSSKNSANSTFSKEAGGMIKAYNNTMTGTYYFIPYGGTYSGADTTSDFDAYVVSSKSATVPSSVVSPGPIFNLSCNLSNIFWEPFT